jgi:stress response protein YsnF
MTSQEQWANLTGATAIDADGDKIGSVGQVYISNDTDQPEWVAVNTGLFGMRESLAPLSNAELGQGEVRLAVTKQQIKDAPNPDLDDEDLDPAEIDALYRYYADYLAPAGTEPAASGTEYADPGTGPVDADPEYADAGTGYTDTGSTGDAVTRSGERLDLDTGSVPAERVRLRKYVVTEYVTVPVSHEEIRIERGPITEDDRGASAGQGISGVDDGVMSPPGRPVAESEGLPVDQSRLSTETVTEEVPVDEQTGDEQIGEPNADADPGRDGR